MGRNGRDGRGAHVPIGSRDPAVGPASPQADLILSDKFEPAALPDVCAPRLRVVDALDRAARKRYVYIGAPAGSGKTVSTLLWLQKTKLPAVWIGLDRYDDVPSMFYKQLATGLYSVQPENAAMREVLTSPSFSLSPVEHTIRLIAEMQPLDHRCALVFDDLHFIENREIVKSLSVVLKRLPKAFVLFFLSRREPPDEWTALGIDRGPAVLDAGDLRFAADEIRAYFKSLGRSLSVDESRIVLAATEGWAIGVAALAKSGQVTKGDSRSLFGDFFDEQVWSTWDEDLRSFCLAASVAGEFDAELAEILSGRSDAAEIMDELARSNTFLMRLSGNSYRYHHLFRDFLQDKARENGTDRTALCKRAAEYSRARFDYTQVLRFWLESGDFSGMDTYLLLYLYESRSGSVADCADFMRTLALDELPDHAYRDCPPLHILALWYDYLTGQRERFEHHLDELYRALPRIAAFDSRFVESATLSYSIDHRTTIIDKAKRFSKFGRLIKRFTPNGLATTLVSFTQNLPYPHRSNVDYSAIALEERGMELLGATFGPLLGTEWGYIQALIPASFAYERNHLGEALDGVLDAESALIPENKADGRICIGIMRHATLWQMGRKDEAAGAMACLEAYVESDAPHFQHNLLAYQAKLALFDADARVAREWLDGYFVDVVDRIDLVRVFQHFTTARALAVLGRVEESEHLLKALLEFGRGFCRPLDIGEAGALLASLLWACGRREEALEALADALEVLQPYGFFRVVADEGASIEPVLKSLASHIARPDYGGPLARVFVQETLLASHDRAKRFRGVTANLTANDKPVRLSRQQARMLELLASGMSNAEIAEETGLSIPTIKSHTAAAYRKLDVHTAMDAVLKARELGLIG